MEKKIRKLSECSGGYFNAKTPATIFGSSDGRIYAVYKSIHESLPGYIIAELKNFEYDFSNNTCYNRITGKQNIPFDQIVTQTIKSGSIDFHDHSNLEQSVNCEQYLYAYLNSKPC